MPNMARKSILKRVRRALYMSHLIEHLSYYFKTELRFAEPIALAELFLVAGCQLVVGI